MTRTLPLRCTAALLVAVLMPAATTGQRQPAPQSGKQPPIETFFLAAKQDDAEAQPALKELSANWDNSYAALFLDLLSVMRVPRPEVSTSGEPVPSDHPRLRIRERIISFLEKHTGQKFGRDLRRWRQWAANLPYRPHPEYARFKAELYANVDPQMRAFFAPGTRALIRLDEIDWGGVSVNGIPPLVQPKVIAAAQAAYLKDNHIVFGVFINGQARAYPKRILAWHELARDRVGGVEMAIVYCTLCGTVIPYESAAGGRRFTLGTSGLLYRSNKLMFDEETSSLWSTLEGKPVVGPLAGSELRLRVHPVVTTTWREWKAAHPDTTVLSLDTGVKRDYSEGAAYRDYFATDDLMFSVPATDARLRNKAEVLTMRLAPAANPAGELVPVAVSVELLRKNPVYHLSAAGSELVIVTSRDGANRVYRSGAARFVTLGADGRALDSAGRAWRVTEEALIAEHDAAQRLPRVPAQRAFWFGWHAQFPQTVLFK